MMHMKPCKGCGKPILWGVTDDGKKIPLDPTPPTYLTDFNGREVRAVRVHGTYVSHFATCSQANRFSSANRVKEAQSHE